MDSRDSLNQTLDSIDLAISPVKYRNAQRDMEKSNEDTSDNNIDEMVKFYKDKARHVYGKDTDEQRDMEKTDENINDDRYQTVKSNKGRATKVYAIKTKRKRIFKQRKEKALQNAKDRNAGKANAQTALQANTRATKASKDTQDIKMTDNATTGQGSTVDVHLPPHSSGKAKHPSQIKISSKHRTAITEPSLGDPLPGSQATARVNGHMSDSGNIGVYRFLIEGAPNPPDLEGIDEDQLLQIQQNIQDKLKQRDEERERNITKRMKQYEEKYDFINKALLESIIHITEVTQTDHPMVSAKVKSADKMVMLPPLFDGNKPEVAKQHYERFNQYIKFQTKSGNIKDPIVEAIELFKHTLDKKALVWFQEHKDMFVDLATLKTMFLQRYNPWGKTKRDQLQSWNVLTFDPQRTDVDEHIDLMNTLGDMLGQTAKSKMEKFVDTMPTIIQTHLITCENWEKTTKKAKELEHIIRKCDPLAAALPILTQGTAVPGLYSHIAHLNDKEEADILQPFKGARPKQTKTRGRGKGKQP